MHGYVIPFHLSKDTTRALIITTADKLRLLTSGAVVDIRPSTIYFGLHASRKSIVYPFRYFPTATCFNANGYLVCAVLSSRYRKLLVFATILENTLAVRRHTFGGIRKRLIKSLHRGRFFALTASRTVRWRPKMLRNAERLTG